MASQQTFRGQNMTNGNGESRSRREQRHASRANATYAEFLQLLRTNGFTSDEEAERAALGVLCTLGQRLNADETWNLHSQLPSRLRELLTRCEHYQSVKPRQIGRTEFMELVSRHLDDATVTPERSVSIVFESIAEQVSPGELHKIIHELPASLRELWPAWARAANETRPPIKAAPSISSPDTLSAPALVEQMLELPIDAQLGILRTIAPRILAQLDDGEREGFLRDLNIEVSFALSGRATYDIRRPLPEHG